ncbi:MAG: hypothetical protein ABIQ93_00125, partial [Saprospiraceae bacterium]
LQIPASLLPKTDLTLVISYTGYASERVLLSAQSATEKIDLKVVKLSTAFLGEMQLIGIVVGGPYWRPTFKQRLHHFFHPNR